jgi:dihydroorotate dehydrogenase electron transfer subunit
VKKNIDVFTVARNQRLNHEYVVLDLQLDKKLPEMQPGQFVQVKVENSPNTYLRRPISIHDIDYENNTIKLLVQEVGEGTRWMGNLLIGDKVDLIYPLGNWFTITESKKVLLVGGGCGVAPLLFLGRILLQNNIQPQFLIGARSSNYLIGLDDYERLGEVYKTTEDGSIGTKGYVIHHPIMKTIKPDFDMIYTCGPDAMMKVIAKYAANHNIVCQVSLENSMACGFGACLCCVTSTTSGNKCTCIDGPVFDSKILKW